MVIWMILAQFYGGSFDIFKSCFSPKKKKTHLISLHVWSHFFFTQGIHIHNDNPTVFCYLQDLGGALRAATYVGHEEVTSHLAPSVIVARVQSYRSNQHKGGISKMRWSDIGYVYFAQGTTFFEDDFPFPKVEDISSLEVTYIWVV